MKNWPLGKGRTQDAALRQLAGGKLTENFPPDLCWALSLDLKLSTGAEQGVLPA